ncbi:MAG: hypothetical protein AAGJ37_02075 [Pseudomonadota bacterium]
MNDSQRQLEPSLWRQTVLPTLSLFTSLSTLVCCALPALLVTIGLGASLAGLISIAPWITVVSEWKIPIFVVAGVMLCLVAILQWRARTLPCPTDPIKARACSRIRSISWWILGLAGTAYLIGFFFAFLAIHFL